MTYTIRPATLADLPGIFAMVEHFLEATSYGAVLMPRPDALRHMAQLVLELDAERGAAFVAVDGDSQALVGLIAVVVGFNMLGDTHYADELVWWVEPPARRAGIGPALLETAEQWARGKSLTVLKMIAPHHSRSVGRFYERYGYVPVEVVYFKGLVGDGSDHGDAARRGAGRLPVRRQEAGREPAGGGGPGD